MRAKAVWKNKKGLTDSLVCVRSSLFPVRIAVKLKRRSSFDGVPKAFFSGLKLVFAATFNSTQNVRSATRTATYLSDAAFQEKKTLFVLPLQINFGKAGCEGLPSSQCLISIFFSRKVLSALCHFHL